MKNTQIPSLKQFPPQIVSSLNDGQNFMPKNLSDVSIKKKIGSHKRKKTEYFQQVNFNRDSAADYPSLKTT